MVRATKKLKKSKYSAFLFILSVCSLVGEVFVLVWPSDSMSFEMFLISQLKNITMGASSSEVERDTEPLINLSRTVHRTLHYEQRMRHEFPSNQTNDEESNEIRFKNFSTAAPQYCVTKECNYYQNAEPLSRAFPDHRSWCTNTSSESNIWQGILLVKVPKAASSTSAGVALRIAHKYKCAVQWQHRLAQDYKVHHSQNTFLFTTIRNPASRAVSSIFFHVVSQKNVPATDNLVLGHLTEASDSHYGSLSRGQGGFTLRYASLDPIQEGSAFSTNDTKVLSNLLQANVKKVVDAYDFLLIVERMEESLVAMSMVMGVEVGDVLTTASKVAGSNYYLTRNPKRCIATVKSFMSPGVQRHLDSEEWHAQNYGDYLLHAAANLSLNKTIERLGVQKFQIKLKEFQALRALEKHVCAPHVQFPCSDGGEPQPKVARESCYKGFYDFGCGHKCHDAMIRNLTRAQQGLNTGFPEG